MRLKKHLWVLLASLGIAFSGIYATTSTAHAATWHKGTPTAIKGTWRTKTSHNLQVIIRAGKSTYNNMEAYSTKEHATIAGPYRITNIHYHHKSGSQYYYIKGAHNTEPGTKQVYYVIQKVGNKLRERLYGQSVKGHYTKLNFKYDAWYYKS